MYNHYYKLGDMFRFAEPSSGQFLKQSNGTFRECAHYGIPYSLQTIFDIGSHVTFSWPMYGDICKTTVSIHYLQFKISC